MVRAAHPGLVLEPYVDIGQVLEQRVADGELDFAVIAGRSSRVGIASATIGQAAFFLVAPAALQGETRMSPALLARLPLVTLPGAGTTRIIDDWLAGREAPGERLCCNNWGAIAGLLDRGHRRGPAAQPLGRRARGRGQPARATASRPGGAAVFFQLPR